MYASNQELILAYSVPNVFAPTYLEELAAEFGLRTQDVVSRVQALETMGRITGGEELDLCGRRRGGSEKEPWVGLHPTPLPLSAPPRPPRRQPRCRDDLYSLSHISVRVRRH